METVNATVNIKWTGARLMLGVDSRGITIPIGYNREEDPTWSGIKPSDLLLLAAASCAAYDVVDILQKQREPVEGLDIQCSGDQNAEQPYNFVNIHLKYMLKGGIDPKKAERAIQLSEDKYCSVLATLRPSLEITSEFEIVD